MTRRWFAIAALASLCGCASTPDVRVDQAQGGVAACRSFAWLPASQDAASLTEQRVRTAVMRELEDKGYAQNAGDPDCRITYVLNVQEAPPQRPSVGVGAGGGTGGVHGGIGVSIPVGKRDRYTGEFTLDVIDAAQKQQIWSGSVDAGFRDAELSVEEADEVVRRVLAALPARDG